MWGIADIWWVLINSFVSFVYLFIIAKILGKKQIAQLEFIDYVVGISLGSIAADMATETEQPFYHSIIAMTIFFALAFLVAIVGRKNTFFKHVLKGKPSVLIYQGQIDYKMLVKCKIDVNDLLSMLREKNFFDITEVAYALFEPSGKLSVLPKSSSRPLVLTDIEKKIGEKASLTNVLVADGKISKSGLNEIGKDKPWLVKQLGLDKAKQIKQVLLAIYDEKSCGVRAYFKNQTNFSKAK